MNKDITPTDIERYVNMSHSIQIKEDNGGFVVMIPDLPGCISQADTLEEAYKMIMDAKRAWIESALEDNESIPEPSEDKKFSGKILLRIPPELHAELTKVAHQQGISLNQHLTYLLTKENVKMELHFHQTTQYNIDTVEVISSELPSLSRLDRY